MGEGMKTSWTLSRLGTVGVSMLLLMLPSGGFAQFPGGPPMREKMKVVEQFDKDGDKRLDAAERKAAREFVRAERVRNPRRGPRFRPEEEEVQPKPGRKISPDEVKAIASADLYDPEVVRTLFLEFEDVEWEGELADFKDTDVEVPAKLTVDGKTYRDVGVHFRGMSSFSMVGAGRKRSLNLSMDFVHADQRLLGERTLNLLNSHEDPTFLRTVLYSQIARQYIATPKANFVQVVINGEDWGIYVNAEQFNKDFVKDRFGETKGARWKVPGSPSAQGGLEYIGSDEEDYRKSYRLMSKEDPKAWKHLIELCRVMHQTPPERLEKELGPLLDIDGALKFLALENVFINDDGYWIRTSDYSIYEDSKGQFHIIPHDTNETFSRPGGPGFGGFRGGGGGRGFGPGRGGPGPGGPMGMLPPPPALLARRMIEVGDQNGDGKLSRAEFAGVGRSWFATLNSQRTGRVNQREFEDGFSKIVRPPGPAGPDRGDGPGPGPGRGPAGGPFVTVLFHALDGNGDGVITIGDVQETFDRWFKRWDSDRNGQLDEEELRAGVASELGMPAPGAGPGPMNMRGGGGAGGGGNRVDGVKLDPLFGSDQPRKALLARLLAVPELRKRYISFVRELTEKWLDWKQVGPIAEKYHSLIAKEVQLDTRKLDSTEDFNKGLIEDIPGRGFGPGGRGTIGLKSFVDQRGEYLREWLARTEK